MARVCFLPSAELGHLVPTLRVAEDLARRGHEVVYLTAPAFAERVHAHGLGVEPIWDDWFSPEFERTRAVGTSDDSAGAWDRFLTEETELFLGDRLAATIERGGYDVIVSDVLMLPGPVIAWSLGVPCIQYTTCAPIDIAPVGPEHDAHVQRGLERQRAIDASFMATYPEQLEIWPRLRGKYGYQEAWVLNEGGLFGVRCTTAERVLLLCPPALVPDPSVARRFEFCQSLPRPADEPWRPRALESRRVCLSFGSNGGRYPAGERVASALVGAMAQLPAFHMTTLGLPEAMAREHADLGNVEFAGYISQRALLDEGVRVMCSHGGLGTFKECMYTGTPLVVTPFSFDQPVNALFVDALGVGAAVDPDAATEEIAATLLAALSGDAHAEAAAALADEVRGFEREETGAAAIEAALR